MILSVRKSARATVGNYLWTQHSRQKMKFYALSEQTVKRVVRSPFRQEEGIAPQTVASMQPRGKGAKSLRHKMGRAGKEKWSQEIWVMWQWTSPKLQNKRIISAWRYPGVSPKLGPVPIPDDVLFELEKIKNRSQY